MARKTGIRYRLSWKGGLQSSAVNGEQLYASRAEHRLMACKQNKQLHLMCMNRWHNYLKPDIRKDAWRPEEDQLIMEYHRACKLHDTR
eukprot:50308-Eustigmatos_ZCMA.PRE.1